MNANRYRLIFDKRTGMLIPVAEFTPAARKGNGRGAGEGMGDTTSPKWNRMFVAMTLAAGGLGSSWSLHSQNLPLTPRELLRMLHERGIRFMTVKTLAASHPDPNYAKTRRFYEAIGFLPLEVLPTLWGCSNPCLLMLKPVTR